MRELDNLTKVLLEKYVRYEGGNFFIIHDNSNEEIAKSIRDNADNIVSNLQKNEENIRVRIENLDMHRGKYSLESIPASVMDHMKKAFSKDENPANNVLLYIMQQTEGEPNHGKELVRFAQPLGIKIGGLPGCTMNVLKSGYNQSNKQEFVTELYDFLQEQKEVRAKSKNGTDIVFTYDTDKYNWVKSDGILVPGKYGNPIPAEVYTYPADANGKFVITGSYAHFMSLSRYANNFGRLVKDLKKTPLTWNIKEGKITSVKCADKFLEKEAYKQVFETDTEHGMKIGETGYPANLYVLENELTGNLLIDEKGRFHAAHGDAYITRTNAPYESKVHFDGLSEKITLYSPKLDTNFMVNDRYSPEIFKSLRK